jgi:hemolysin III
LIGSPVAAWRISAQQFTHVTHGATTCDPACPHVALFARPLCRNTRGLAKTLGLNHWDSGETENKAMSYPTFTRPERIADGTVHVLGIMGSLAAVAILISISHSKLSAGTLVATIVYSITLIVMLTASGSYHLAAHTRARPLLRRLDHAAIYVKIAGTLTPLAVLLGTGFGYLVLAVVWLIALFGASRKLLAKRGKMTTGWLPYVALGWIGVMLLFPLTKTVPTQAMILIATGGLTYTAGVFFYRAEGWRYATAIWHGFVLVASGCFFAAIATSVLAAG